MSANGTRTIVWAGGEDRFCVAKIGDILDLEEKCGAGIAEIAHRLANGTWRINDIRESIRIGLIGGGAPPEKAMIAVKRHVDPDPNDLNRNPLARSVLLAYTILASTLVGVPGDQPGKKQEAEQESPSTDETVASSAPPSSPQAPVLDGRRARPSNARSGKLQPPLTGTTQPRVGNPT